MTGLIYTMYLSIRVSSSGSEDDTIFLGSNLTGCSLFFLFNFFFIFWGAGGLILLFYSCLIFFSFYFFTFNIY